MNNKVGEHITLDFHGVHEDHKPEFYEKIFKKSDGAIIFPGEDHGLHNRVFINSHGLPTYEAKELGLNTEKFKKYVMMEAYSISYSTTVGTAAVAVGYSGYDANNNTSSRTDVTFSQSIGGGASIFAEFQNLTGAGVAAETNTTSESVVAIGTSVSF